MPRLIETRRAESVKTVPATRKAAPVPATVKKVAAPSAKKGTPTPKSVVAWVDRDLNSVPAPGSSKTKAKRKKAEVLVGREKTPASDHDGFITLDGFFKIHKGTYQILRRNIIKRENTLLLGPTGFGKTELVYHMAKHLGVPLTIFDMGTMTDPIMGLVGTNTIQVQEGVTVSKFIKSRFSEVIQKPGIVLLDELSRASLQANNLLFPCLDFRRELNMEYAFNDSAPIAIHPNCVFFATANIGSQYSGTSKIDRALLDRFMLLEMDSLKKNQIENILKYIYPRVAATDITVIVDIYEKINKANEEFTISFGLSFRHLKLITSLVQDGFTIYDGYYTLCKGLASKEGLKSIESILSTKGAKAIPVISPIPEPEPDKPCEEGDEEEDYDDDDEDA